MQAQVIQVVEDISNLPVDRVLIINKNQTQHVYTNSEGKADIGIFSDKDMLTFSHIAFVHKEILKEDIIAENKVVYLEDASEAIEEVVLSASRSREKVQRIAEHIEVINQHKIWQESPQTSPDLLALTPGVKVQKSQSGGGSPVLRGMESNRVLLVVDGVRMNNAIYRKGHLQNSLTVSPNLLARTEILFGPSSIIYGSDALGGVVHYYTKKPELNDTKQLFSTVLSRYSSVNNEYTLSYSGEFSHKKWASLTGVSVSKFGDMKMGKNRTHGFDNWGLVPYYSKNTPHKYYATPSVNPYPSLQQNTAYKQLDLLEKVFIPIDTKTDVTLNLQYSNSSNIPRFDKLHENKNGSLKYAEWYYGPQKRFLAASQLQIKPRKIWLHDGQITLAFQDITESRNTRKFNSLKKYFRKENVKVYSANADFHVPLTKDKQRILSYGLETTYNKVHSDAVGKTLQVSNNSVVGFEDTFHIQSRYPDDGSSYASFAGYTNYRFDHSLKGTLNAGLRYTYTVLQALWKDTSFIQLEHPSVSLHNGALSGTLGYAYKPTARWQLNAVVSSGFRAPNIDDIGKIREKRGYVSLPNTALKPEFAYNAEIGIVHYTSSRKTLLGLNAYYMLLHHYITRDLYNYNGTGTILYDGEQVKTIANVNKGNAFITGSTFRVKSKLSEHFQLNASLTYTLGKALDQDEPLSSIPPVFGNTQVSYNIKRWHFDVSQYFNARKKPEDYNITEGIDNIEETPVIDAQATEKIHKYYGSPAWQTINLVTGYKINSNANLRLHIHNLLDIHYKEFASGIVAPGRNISISLNAHF